MQNITTQYLVAVHGMSAINMITIGDLINEFIEEVTDVVLRDSERIYPPYRRDFELIDIKYNSTIVKDFDDKEVIRDAALVIYKYTEYQDSKKLPKNIG